MLLYRTKIVVAVAMISLWGSSTSRAQTPAPRVGAGVQYSALVLDYPGQTRSGLGGWFTYDFTRWLALDTSLAFYPGDDELTGRQWQGLVGAKVGWRNERFGLFGRVRPGWQSFSGEFSPPDIICTLDGPQQSPPDEGCFASSTNFALDAGGGVEFYPTRSTVLRIDGGDRMIRFSRPPVWTHNFQVDVAAGWRF